VGATAQIRPAVARRRHLSNLDRQAAMTADPDPSSDPDRATILATTSTASIE
jgi:hypothetical protein